MVQSLIDPKEIDPRKHLIESQQVDDAYLREVFELAAFMKRNEGRVSHMLRDKIVVTAFSQESTRTRGSFEAAALRLGAGVITFTDAEKTSSVAKGEDLEDTIKTLSGYGDFIVLRHSANDSSRIAVQFSNGVPIINGGAGSEQHPTQALLDLFTILEQKGRLERLKIGLVGDLCRGRTINSLVYLLSRYPGNEYYFIGPEESPMNEGIRRHLSERGIQFSEYNSLDEYLGWADVWYITRPQLNMMNGDAEKAAFRQKMREFRVTGENVGKMRGDAIIMHPFPRDSSLLDGVPMPEIAKEVDCDPRAVYFEQSLNGKYVRMAILKMMNDHNYPVHGIGKVGQRIGEGVRRLLIYR